MCIRDRWWTGHGRTVASPQDRLRRRRDAEVIVVDRPWSYVHSKTAGADRELIMDVAMDALKQAHKPRRRKTRKEKREAEEGKEHNQEEAEEEKEEEGEGAGDMTEGGTGEVVVGHRRI